MLSGPIRSQATNVRDCRPRRKISDRYTYGSSLRKDKLQGVVSAACIVSLPRVFFLLWNAGARVSLDHDSAMTNRQRAPGSLCEDVAVSSAALSGIVSWIVRPAD